MIFLQLNTYINNFYYFCSKIITMEQQKIIRINFSHFPEDEHAAQIPGKLFLMDNFDVPFKYIDRDEIMSFPVQITMTLAFICRHGEMHVKVNMQDYHLKAAHCITLIPGTFFQMIDVTDDIECCLLAVNPNFIDMSKGLKLGVELTRIATTLQPYKLDYHDMSEMLSIYNALKHKLYQKDYMFKEDVARSYLDIMRCNAFQHIMQMEPKIQPSRPSSRKEEIFMQFIATVHKYYMKERNVGFYADKLCVTPKYLSSVIHEVSSKYATEWINECVIIEAKAMLRSRGMSVKDVCNTLNFANQSFFAKFFKKHTGCTPKEYKNQ